jgi:hypothetical protein
MVKVQHMNDLMGSDVISWMYSLSYDSLSIRCVWASRTKVCPSLLRFKWRIIRTCIWLTRSRYLLHHIPSHILSSTTLSYLWDHKHALLDICITSITMFWFHTKQLLWLMHRHWLVPKTTAGEWCRRSSVAYVQHEIWCVFMRLRCSAEAVSPAECCEHGIAMLHWGVHVADDSKSDTRTHVGTEFRLKHEGSGLRFTR